jgi:uncharacterized integral membrane protein
VATESSNQKVRPLWRWVAVVIALAIGLYEILGYKIARSINLSYFNDPSVPISVVDIGAVLVGLYLAAIAVFGYWRFQRSDS